MAADDAGEAVQVEDVAHGAHHQLVRRHRLHTRAAPRPVQSEIDRQR
jgi:hypothetical protein